VVEMKAKFMSITLFSVSEWSPGMTFRSRQPSLLPFYEAANDLGVPGTHFIPCYQVKYRARIQIEWKHCGIISVCQWILLFVLGFLWFFL